MIDFRLGIVLSIFLFAFSVIPYGLFTITTHRMRFLFQSFLCQGLAPRVIRLMANGIATFKNYSVQFEKDAFVEHCYVLFWEGGHLKKVCVGSEPVDQPVPTAELVPLSRVIHSLYSKQMPLAVVGASPSLLRVIGDNRTDGRRFVVHQGFTEELFLQSIRQAHQDIFGMVEVTTIVEYVVHRLRNAVYEEWTEDKIVLCRCLRKSSVDFCDYRELLTDLIELGPRVVLKSDVL